MNTIQTGFYYYLWNVVDKDELKREIAEMQEIGGPNTIACVSTLGEPMAKNLELFVPLAQAANMRCCLMLEGSNPRTTSAQINAQLQLINPQTDASNYWHIDDRPVLYWWNMSQVPLSVIKAVKNLVQDYFIISDGLWDFASHFEGMASYADCWSQGTPEKILASFNYAHDLADAFNRFLVLPMAGSYNRNGVTWGDNNGHMMVFTGIAGVMRQANAIFTSYNEGCALQPEPGLENTGLWTPTGWTGANPLKAAAANVFNLCRQ